MVIEAKNISKSYGDIQAVDGINFLVKQGTCFGLLGPNGAGKSTIMRLIYGKSLRDHVQTSQLNVLGFDPQIQSRQIKSLTGVVSQDNNLDLDLSVEKNLIIYSRFYGMEKNEAQKRIDELLHFMELNSKRNQTIHSLSGGMQRRLVIVRALLHNPKLLLLDEPTTGLDPQVRQLIWSKLHLLKKQGVAIVLTTHYMEEAFDLCDDLIINHEGKKILHGHPQKILQENIEKYILQVSNIEKWQAILKQKKVSLRYELLEQHANVYSNSLTRLTQLSKKFSPQDFYLRQTTLEDVFIKVTGSSLHE